MKENVEDILDLFLSSYQFWRKYRGGYWIAYRVIYNTHFRSLYFHDYIQWERYNKVTEPCNEEMQTKTKFFRNAENYL